MKEPKEQTKTIYLCPDCGKRIDSDTIILHEGDGIKCRCKGGWWVRTNTTKSGWIFKWGKRN